MYNLDTTYFPGHCHHEFKATDEFRHTSEHTDG